MNSVTYVEPDVFEDVQVESSRGFEVWAGSMKIPGLLCVMLGFAGGWGIDDIKPNSTWLVQNEN